MLSARSVLFSSTEALITPGTSVGLSRLARIESIVHPPAATRSDARRMRSAVSVSMFVPSVPPSGFVMLFQPPTANVMTVSVLALSVIGPVDVA